MIIAATTPAAIVVRTVNTSLDPRGGVISIPDADGVRAQLIYPANDAPAGIIVYVAAAGPASVQRLGVAPFGGNRNYVAFYQLKITIAVPASTTVHFRGSPKLLLNVLKPTPQTQYALQLRFGGNYGIGMGADRKGVSPQFTLDRVPSIFRDGLITVELQPTTTVIATVSAIVVTPTLEGRINAALGKLAEFRRSGALGDLETAIYAMQSSLDIDLFRFDTFVAQRRTFVNGWAQLLRALESSYDPTFDPKNRLPCPPPPPYNGMLPWNCDPKLAAGPQSPSVRIKEIQDLQRFQARFQRYDSIQRLDAMAMTSLRMSLDLIRKIAPNGTPSDFSALDATLRSSGISDARRKTIDQWFYAREGPCLYIGSWPCKH